MSAYSIGVITSWQKKDYRKLQKEIEFAKLQLQLQKEAYERLIGAMRDALEAWMQYDKAKVRRQWLWAAKRLEAAKAKTEKALS